VLWRDARREFVKLLHRKQSAYWTGHIDWLDVIRLKPVRLLLTSFTVISMRKSPVFEPPQTERINPHFYPLQPEVSSDYSHLSR
jgi:hypothetical protein